MPHQCYTNAVSTNVARWPKPHTTFTRPWWWLCPKQLLHDPTQFSTKHPSKQLARAIGGIGHSWVIQRLCCNRI
jgi:hypothetical protein